MISGEISIHFTSTKDFCEIARAVKTMLNRNGIYKYVLVDELPTGGSYSLHISEVLNADQATLPFVIVEILEKEETDE